MHASYVMLLQKVVVGSCWAKRVQSSNDNWRAVRQAEEGGLIAFCLLKEEKKRNTFDKSTTKVLLLHYVYI